MASRRPKKEKQTPADTDATVAKILARFGRLGNPRNVAGMARFGISSEGTYGISVPALRAMAKEYGRDHALALALWDTGKHEARILACMVEDLTALSSAQADRWVRDIDSWDVCDGFAYDMISRAPFRWQKPARWAASKHEFTRRAAFALIAGLAMHDKAAPDSQFIALLPLIESAATDERNFVKKAVNWALRQVGKRNLRLNRAAIASAERIRRLDSPSARWIAADALRELRGDAVQIRLHAKAALEPGARGAHERATGAARRMR